MFHNRIKIPAGKIGKDKKFKNEEYNQIPPLDCSYAGIAPI